MSSWGSPLSTSFSGSHMDLSSNRPGSSWPDKLHSQRPFPSLGKKVCILFSPAVTNMSRGVVRLSSLWTTLKPKTTRNVYILHPCFPYFYLHNWGHTWESAQQQRKRQDSGLLLEVIHNQRWGITSIIRNRNISKNYWESWFHFYCIGINVTSSILTTSLFSFHCKADCNKNKVKLFLHFVHHRLCQLILNYRNQ